VTKRAVWLERTFFQHIVGGIKLAAEMKIHPLDLKGSFAGAIGLPQFLPGHHYNFGVDGNRDGAVDLFVPADAILSVGKYLNNHGWQSKRPPIKQQRAVIAEYNRSIPYIDTVLAMASQLERSLPPAPSAKKGN
jgi:membrane-bound lytic murein transglycosylase B